MEVVREKERGRRKNRGEISLFFFRRDEEKVESLSRWYF